MINVSYPELYDPALRRFVYKRALERNGREVQLTVACEELSELIKEVCKCIRGLGNEDHLVEELADVRIMVEQLEMIFDVREKVETEMLVKMNRLVRKLDNGE